MVCQKMSFFSMLVKPWFYSSIYPCVFLFFRVCQICLLEKGGVLTILLNVSEPSLYRFLIQYSSTLALERVSDILL